MAEIIWIRIKASGDVTWARPDVAARLVAAGNAVYIDKPAPETLPAPNPASKKGRR